MSDGELWAATWFCVMLACVAFTIAREIWLTSKRTALLLIAFFGGSATVTTAIWLVIS